VIAITKRRFSAPEFPHARGAFASKIVAKIAKPTGSKLVKGPAESEKFVRWKSMKNSEENS
jgi:hypothetical protein